MFSKVFFHSSSVLLVIVNIKNVEFKEFLFKLLLSLSTFKELLLNSTIFIMIFVIVTAFFGLLNSNSKYKIAFNKEERKCKRLSFVDLHTIHRYLEMILLFCNITEDKNVNIVEKKNLVLFKQTIFHYFVPPNLFSNTI